MTHPSAADAATNEIDHYLSLRVIIYGGIRRRPTEILGKASVFVSNTQCCRKSISWNERNFWPSGVYVQYNRNNF